MHMNYDYLNGMFEGFDYYQSKCNLTAVFPEDQAPVSYTHLTLPTILLV